MRGGITYNLAVLLSLLHYQVHIIHHNRSSTQKLFCKEFVMSLSGGDTSAQELSKLFSSKYSPDQKPKQ